MKMIKSIVASAKILMLFSYIYILSGLGLLGV